MQMSYGIERTKGTTSIGVISCRSRGASLIQTIHELMRRRSVTGVILDPKGGDTLPASPPLGSKITPVTLRRRINSCIVWDQ